MTAVRVDGFGCVPTVIRTSISGDHATRGLFDGNWLRSFDDHRFCPYDSISSHLPTASQNNLGGIEWNC
jgi:hypothetical protein